MIKVNEFFRGCSVRTGTLILLWVWLIAGGYGILANILLIIFNEELLVYTFIFLDSHSLRYIILQYGPYFDLVLSVTCCVTSLLAIIGIHKDKGKYLTPYLYFEGFFTLYYFLSPLKEYFVNYEIEDLLYSYAGVTWVTAILVYFWIITRNCRNTMLEKAAGNNVTESPYSINEPPPYSKS